MLFVIRPKWSEKKKSKNTKDTRDYFLLLAFHLFIFNFGSEKGHLQQRTQWNEQGNTYFDLHTENVKKQKK